VLLRVRPIQALAQISQFSKWTKAIYFANMKAIKANISFREQLSKQIHQLQESQ